MHKTVDKLSSPIYRTRDHNVLLSKKDGNFSNGAEVFFSSSRDLREYEQGRSFVDTGLASFSPDGLLWAYQVQTAGSDWAKIRIRDVERGGDLPEELLWVKFSMIMWSPDSLGFFYTSFEQPKDEDLETAGSGTSRLGKQRLKYHRIGTNQSQDVSVYEHEGNSTVQPLLQFSVDDRYLLLSISKGTENQNDVSIIDL